MTKFDVLGVKNARSAAHKRATPPNTKTPHWHVRGGRVASS
ncbi:Uncharacterised protein [Vibrio cholerae]|nr:Uncharacterised protein [Vibrio cholerae]CSI61410.1 Uncharacterised protein [Vibrio cholerae]